MGAPLNPSKEKGHVKYPVLPRAPTAKHRQGHLTLGKGQKRNGGDQPAQDAASADTCPGQGNL